MMPSANPNPRNHVIAFITTAIQACFVLAALLVIAVSLLSGSSIAVKLVNLAFGLAVLGVIYAINMYAWRRFADRYASRRSEPLNHG